MRDVPLLSDWSGLAAPQLTGRFVLTDTGLCFSWSGSAVTVCFFGTELGADLEDAGQNRFYVAVDGKLLPRKVVPGRGRRTLTLVSGLAPGAHTVTLYRLTEPFVGITQIFGFLVPGGKLLPPPARLSRRIELIGDSISTGYGNEDPDPSHGFAPSTQNHYQTYGAIAARSLDADLVTIAWSGKGVFSNRGNERDRELMPDLWRRIIPQREHSIWTFPDPAPGAVVINLGSNDFAPEVQDTNGFYAAYRHFVKELRRTYPAAYILCTFGPLLSDDGPNGHDALTAVRRTLTGVVEEHRRAGDDQVETFEFEPVEPSEGFGADYHPSLATHVRMGRALAAHLRKRLGWTSQAVVTGDLP